MTCDFADLSGAERTRTADFLLAKRSGLNAVLTRETLVTDERKSRSYLLSRDRENIVGSALGGYSRPPHDQSHNRCRDWHSWCALQNRHENKGKHMTHKKVWVITGAGRSMGTDIARAALAAGHAVVATGRNPEKVDKAVGAADDLLAVKLDVTDTADADATVQAAVERFGCIDVLVNNAGNFYAGFFEEIGPEDFRAQVETTLFGPMNVTRAVLPVMRAQRSGLVVAISSTAGIVGQEFCTAYAASKFGVEGWIESLTPEVAPFGIRTMLVEPGFFRTELLTPESTNYAESSIDDYAERTEQTVAAWNGLNGRQGGDPAKLAAALVTVAQQENPPLRWVAGADAIASVEQKANALLAQVDAYRELSSNLAHDDA